MRWGAMGRDMARWGAIRHDGVRCAMAWRVAPEAADSSWVRA